MTGSMEENDNDSVVQIASVQTYTSRTEKGTLPRIRDRKLPDVFIQTTLGHYVVYTNNSRR